MRVSAEYGRVRCRCRVFLMAGTLFVGGQSPPRTKVVDLIPASLSGETNQDSEPFLAVQAVNPQVMVASAFTPNPIRMLEMPCICLRGWGQHLGP